MPKFVWCDVMTTDCKAADSGTGADYTLFSMETAMVAGLIPIPADARANGMRPRYNRHIAQRFER